MRRKKGVKCLSKIKKTEATVLRADYNMTDREQTITEINESMQSKQKKNDRPFWQHSVYQSI